MTREKIYKEKAGFARKTILSRQNAHAKRLVGESYKDLTIHSYILHKFLLRFWTVGVILRSTSQRKEEVRLMKLKKLVRDDVDEMIFCDGIWNQSER